MAITTTHPTAFPRLQTVEQSKTNSTVKYEIIPSKFHNPTMKTAENIKMWLKEKQDLEKTLTQTPHSIAHRAKLIGNCLLLSGSSDNEIEKANFFKQAETYLQESFKLNYFNSKIHECAYYIQLFDGIHFHNLNELTEAAHKLKRSICLDPENKTAQKSYEIFQQHVTIRWEEERKDNQLSEKDYNALLEKFNSILTCNPFQSEKNIPFDHFSKAPADFQKQHPYLVNSDSFSAKFALLTEFEVIFNSGKAFIKESTAFKLKDMNASTLNDLTNSLGGLELIYVEDKIFAELTKNKPLTIKLV